MKNETKSKDPKDPKDPKVENMDISSFLQITSMKAYRKYLQEKKKSDISYIPLLQLYSEKDTMAPKSSLLVGSKTGDANNISKKNKSLFDSLFKKSNKRKYAIAADCQSCQSCQSLETERASPSDLLFETSFEKTSLLKGIPRNVDSPMKIGSCFSQKVGQKKSRLFPNRPLIAPRPTGVKTQDSLKSLQPGLAPLNTIMQTYKVSFDIQRSLGLLHKQPTSISSNLCLDTFASLQRYQLKSLHENLDQQATISLRVKVLERIIDSLTSTE